MDQVSSRYHIDIIAMDLQTIYNIHRITCLCNIYRRVIGITFTHVTLNVGSSKWQQYVEHISPYIVRSSHPLRHAIIVALKRSAANPYMADIKWMQYQIQALRFYISMHASVCLIIIIIIVIIMRIYRLLLLIL